MHLKLHHFSPLGRSLASVLGDGGFDVGDDGNGDIANWQWAKLFLKKANLYECVLCLRI
jgi:hypothetical protein